MQYKVAFNIQVWINSEGKQAYERIKEIKKISNQFQSLNWKF